MLYHTLGSTNIAVAGKWTLNEDVFPIENGNIPASDLLVYQMVSCSSVLVKSVVFLPETIHISAHTN